MSAIFFCVIVAASLVESFPRNDGIHKYFSTKPEVKIINGQVCKPHSMPFIVGINIQTTYGNDFCSGSLISPNYVLTAAHCLEETIKAELIFGAHNITENEQSQVRQEVESGNFIIHPGWGTVRALTNDLALIKLSSPVTQNNYIKVIKLATGVNRFVGRVGRVAGWGLTSSEQTTVTDVLRYVDGEIISNKACRQSDSSYRSVIVATHLCLSGVSSVGDIGTCGGDSGGPLVVEGLQVGVVSFGTSECGIGKPSVFTRVSSYADWIANNTDIALNKE